MIRVGRATYDKKGRINYPSYEGFTPIVVMLKSHSNYYPLSPYSLKNNDNQIMENIWQFSKIYETIPKTTQKKSRYDDTIVWSHNNETHIDSDGKITPQYWQWRNKGMDHEHPVRYPVGFKYRGNCKYAIPQSDLNLKLNYIEARLKIYVPVYCELVKKEANLFVDLQSRLKDGENLLIIEVDGPHQESLAYYQEKYDVNDSFIEDNTLIINKENLTIMISDSKHPFGHGYCLAMALMNIDDMLLDFWVKNISSN